MSVFLPASLPEPGASIVFTVYEDVHDGIAEYLHPVSFDVDGPFASAGALVSDQFAVVQWVFVGVDDGKGFNNLWPTAKSITMRGVTIVDMSGKEWMFHRHIDWNGVSSQLGGSLGRASTPLLVKKPEDALFYASDNYDFEDPD